MNSPKISACRLNSLIQVTFTRGLENPDFRIENLDFECDGEHYSQVATLKACARLFNEKAESIEAEFDKNRNEGVIK